MVGETLRKLKFRHAGKVYTAEVVDIGQGRQTQGNFLYDVALYRIYNGKEEFLGGVLFKESMLLNFVWAEPNKPHLQNEFMHEILVNLLHYLPFYPDKLMPLYEQGSTCYIYRFVRDLDEGEKEEKIFDIKTENSFEKTYSRIMFDDEVTDEKIQNAILEILYVHRLEDYRTCILVKQLEVMIPIEQNKLHANLQFLQDEDLVEILIDTSGILISAKIKNNGIRKVDGTLQPRVQSSQVTNYHYGHNIDVKTGDNSPVSIHADIVDGIFNGFRQELDDKKPENKEELVGALNVLQQEFKKEQKDLGIVQKALKTIKNGAGWLYERILNNQFVGGIMAQIALQQMGLAKK